MSSAPVATSHEIELDFRGLLLRSWKVFVAEPVPHIVAALLLLVGGFVSLGLALGPLTAAYVRMIDRQNRHGQISVDNLWRDLADFRPAMVVAIGSLFAVGAGTLFLVLPGMVVAVLWSFGLWFVALDKLSPAAALTAAMDLARAQPGNVVLVSLIALIVLMLGAASIIGVLVGLPLAMIFLTLAFSGLTGAE